MASIPPGVDLCSIPAGNPPEGVTPNFVDPIDLSVPTLVVGCLITVISTSLWVGRLYVNWRTMRLADYATIVALILSTGYTGVILSMHRSTRHAWDTPACWYIADHTWKILFTSNLLLGPTQFATKGAILVLYFQLFAVGRKMRYLILAGIIFLGVLYLPHPILVAVFQTPRSWESWADLATNGMPQKISYYAPVHGICSIVVDTYIFVIPLLVLRKLHMSKKKRLQLIGVFTIAFIGIVSSVFACYWRFTILFSTSGDFTWQQAQLFIWIILEHNTALIVGSMPGFAVFIKNHVHNSPLFDTLRTRILGGSGGHTGNTSSSGGGVSKSSLPSLRKNRRARPNYYELEESALNTQTDLPPTTTQAAYDASAQRSRPAEGEGKIIRTTEFVQESRPHSLV